MYNGTSSYLVIDVKLSNDSVDNLLLRCGVCPYLVAVTFVSSSNVANASSSMSSVFGCIACNRSLCRSGRLKVTLRFAMPV